MNKTAQILREAAKVIEVHGWHQGHLKDHATGRVCAIGALFTVILGQPDPPWALLMDDNEKRAQFTEAREALAEHLGFTEAEGARDGVPDWNDTPGRTAEDVTTAMEKAAIWVEEQA